MVILRIHEIVCKIFENGKPLCNLKNFSFSKNVLKIRGSGCTTLNVNELLTLKLLSMLCQFHLNKN